MVFFEQMKEFWHTGINGDELIERVAAMGLELKLTARFKTDADLDKFVIDTAMNDGMDSPCFLRHIGALVFIGVEIRF